jgi:hypothetical protein
MKRIITGLVVALALILAAIPFAARAQEGPLDHIVITPVTASVFTGGTQQFTAEGQDSANLTIPGLTFTWSVVAGGGSIDGTGLFTAGIETGTFTNTVNVTTTQSTATSNITATALATVVVIPTTLNRVVISPVTATIATNTAQQFTAVGQDSNNVTLTGITFTWAVVNGGGSISNTGLFTAGNTPGTFENTVNVTATQGNATATASATVTVTAPVLVLDHVVISPLTANITAGHTQQFTAVAQDSNNVTIPNLDFTWAVVAGGGTISDAGLFTAGNTTGTFTNTVRVTATQGEITKTAFATVTVTAAEQELVLDHVVLSPLSANLTVGSSMQFIAVAVDSNNVTIPDLEITWAVVNGGGSINETGLFTAGNATGTFTNTVRASATQEGVTKSAFATVIVTAAPVVEKPAVPPGWSQGEKTGWQGGDVPPGFDNGNKNGWNGGTLPPGFSQGEKTGWGKEDAGNAGPSQANQNRGKSGKK